VDVDAAMVQALRQMKVMFEPGAVDMPTGSVAELAQVSSAISLKRIADLLEKQSTSFGIKVLTTQDS
jgi:hypothetical protein